MLRFIHLIKGTFIDAIKVTASKEGIRRVYGVSLYRNAIYLMLNSIVSALLGIVFWILAARFYRPTDVGLAAALIAAIGLVSSFSNLGLQIGIIRFLPNAGETSIKMINSCFTVSGLASLVTAVIFISGIPFWSPALLPVREHPIFLASFILFAVLLTLCGFLGQVFVAKRSAKFTFIQGLTIGALKLLLVVIFAPFMGTFGIFGSVGVAMAIFTLVAMLWLLPRVQKGYIPLPGISKTPISGMVHYSLRNYFAHFFWGLPTIVLPLMVVNILGTEMNAYFFIASSIAALLFMLPAAISLSLFAEGSYRDDLLWASTLKSIKICLVILPPPVLLIFGIGDKLLLLFGEAYAQNATTLLWILALSVLPLSIIHIFLSIKRVQKDMKSIMGVSVATTCLVLGLSYLLMNRMGITGVGIGWTGGQTIIASLIMLQCRVCHRELTT
jgi:O-antigen/teichoic acid export membrane protein